jgi:hypothetical protein
MYAIVCVVKPNFEFTTEFIIHGSPDPDEVTRIGNKFMDKGIIHEYRVTKFPEKDLTKYEREYAQQLWLGRLFIDAEKQRGNIA